MATADAPLLVALLAFHRGLITREQLLEATGMWMSSPGLDVARLLHDAGRLTADQHAELSKIVGDWRRAHSTAAGAIGPMTPELRETIVHLRRSRPMESEAAPPPEAEGKYEMGVELGRGGIGRVVEAKDAVLGRKVALKLMLADAPPDMLERFRWEARITGRLEHPNIVPVHEVGTLSGTGEVFLCMKRIYGRDMGEVIERGTWPLRKLVEALRDACRAVAYAHSVGILHRDLKPANIMLGDFGEVLVVDWGLARLSGEEDRPSQIRNASTRTRHPRPGRLARHEETANLTLEGDILGTPAYMPPEQAMGWIQKIDERSDVFALGATLFEILAGRAPFLGETPVDIIHKALSAERPKPSEFRTCPADLEAICLKAIAYQPDDRYPTARALQDALDAWLEGATERERRAKLAEEKLAEARRAMERWRKLAVDVRRAWTEGEEAERSPTARVTPEDEKALWAREDREMELQSEEADAFYDADAAIGAALTLVPDHAPGRRLRAELFWERFLQCEATERRLDAHIARRTVEEYNDGALTGRLRGDGALEVRPQAYGCGCLRKGREVSPAELNVLGYHPWSGRRLDGIETACVPALEPGGPVRLRVHAAGCRREPLEGARAWAWRFELEERAWIPVTPPGTPEAAGAPRDALDTLFGSSPLRPRGPGIALGTLPLRPRTWPMGSWLMVILAPGRLPQRVPFEIGRLEGLVLEPTLFGPEEVPPGFLAVQGGNFVSERETQSAGGPIRLEESLDDFFLSRNPTTCGEYCAWLNRLREESPVEARARSPRELRDAGHYWPEGPGGWVVPAADWLASAPPALRAAARRVEGCGADWREDWPVVGVSWEDGQRYARDLSAGGSWLLTVPHMLQWERAARGDDGRRYPFGEQWSPRRANSNMSFQDGHRIVPVGEFPFDESPWGLRDMSGNVACRCLNDPGPSYRHWRAVRGGGWIRTPYFGRVSQHSGADINVPAGWIGIRLAAAVRLSPPTEAAGTPPPTR